MVDLRGHGRTKPLRLDTFDHNLLGNGAVASSADQVRRRDS